MGLLAAALAMWAAIYLFAYERDHTAPEADTPLL